MKVLKLIERILFIVAVALASFAITLSMFLDELNTGGAAPGIATALQGLVGAGIVLFLLLLGAFLRYNKGPVASKLGDAFALASILLIFGSCFAYFAADAGGTTLLFGFVAGIVYAASAIVRLIIYVVKVAKPEMASDSLDPDNDRKVQLIIKWKALLDKGVITQEEFDAKRLEILGIEKPAE